MPQTALQEYNRAAVIAIVLWLNLCEEDWHAMKIREWDAFESWLVQGFKQVMYDKGDEDDDLWWPAVHGPDICGTCYNFFGYTLGGRVREGCIHCHDKGTFKFYIYHMRDRLYINDAHMEWLLATALHEWSRIKPRKQARTQKWIKDNDARFSEEGLKPLDEMSEKERDRIRNLEKDVEEL